MDTKELYARIRKSSAPAPAFIKVATGTLDGLVKGIQTEGRMQQLSKEQRMQLRKESREAIRDLNLRWLDEMVHSPAQLREKMAFFWHGHFACREINIFFQQNLLDILRRHALADFGTLLREVSRSAAMLAFLNNQQNRKQQPNENFAREVMELFTLGRANYTERDIKEAARAFTGWGFDLSGEFVFRKQFHDTGSKTIFGRTGNFDGDDVLDMLLENRQTARHITRKIYRFLVHETPDEAMVQTLADGFYQSGYNIQSLLDSIFSSKWFYKPANIGSRIKSPIELLAGLRRMLPMEFSNEQVQLLYQRLLGQVLFYPPNVAGWPGGMNWIDSSSLMYRMRLPGILDKDLAIGAKPKSDDDVEMGMGEQRAGSGREYVSVKIDWGAYVDRFRNTPKDALGISIAAHLLQSGTVDMELMNRFADRSSREAYIRSMTIRVLSTPEYQVM